MLGASLIFNKKKKLQGILELVLKKRMGKLIIIVLRLFKSLLDFLII
jgi:hypothetical protein